MPADLSKVPVEKRVTLSDEPVHAGRTGSILVSSRVLPAILARLSRESMFFAVTPYPGSVVAVACKIDRVQTLVEAVAQAEKHK